MVNARLGPRKKTDGHERLVGRFKRASSEWGRWENVAVVQATI